MNAGSESRTSPYHPVHLPDLRCPVQREHVQWLITCKHTARRMGCWWPHLQHDAGQRLGNRGWGTPNEGLSEMLPGYSDAQRRRGKGAPVIILQWQKNK